MTDAEEVFVSRDSLDVLEKGSWVRAETQADAVRFAVARAAFLDCLLTDDDVVSHVVDKLNAITHAPEIVERIYQNFDNVQEQSRPNDGAPAKNPDNRAFRDRGLELTRALFAIVTGEDERQTSQMIGAASEWVRDVGCDWPWLVHDLVRWYRDKVMYLSPTGAWYGRISRPPGEWSFSPLEDPEWPQATVRHRKGESTADYRRRAKDTLNNLIKELDDDWPRGRVPSETTIVQRNVEWFYRHRLHGESKVSITMSVFGGTYDHIADPSERTRLIDGRRKDVRDAIRNAEKLLNSSGVNFE